MAPTRLLARWTALTLAAGLLALPFAGGAAPETVAVAAPTERPARRATTTSEAATTTTATTAAAIETTTTATTAPPATTSVPPATTVPAPTTTSPPPPATTDPTTGLSGRVTSWPGGVPIAGICVHVAGPAEVAARTDADGRWSFTFPGPVVVSSIRFADCTGTSPGWLTDVPHPIVPLRAGERATFDVALQPAAALRVRVARADGTRVDAACISVVDEGFTPVGHYRTSASGEVLVTGLRPGRYGVSPPACRQDLLAALPWFEAILVAGQETVVAVPALLMDEDAIPPGIDLLGLIG